MDTEIRRIISLLKASYDGPAWHGPSTLKQLEGLTATEAYAKPITGAHSIWELVLHMMAWRTYCLEKLQGNESFEVEVGGSVDWPEIADSSDAAWELALKAFEENQKALLVTLEAKADALLDVNVPGRKFEFYFLLHGIIQHDIYHGGQIALLKKMKVES